MRDESVQFLIDQAALAVKIRRAEAAGGGCNLSADEVATLVEMLRLLVSGAKDDG